MKQIAGRYNIISKLGQGGMGAVWRVYDRLEQTEVALKQVLVSAGQLDFASKAETDDTNKLRLGLAQEFSILATLRHPHILSVLDYGFDNDGHPFYTMTLLEGGQDVKTYAASISTEARINLWGQMLQALHYLHRRGILHRDLKPDNVFVTPDEQIKVMDFGLAKLENWQSAQSDTITGTIAYMAPEQFQGKSASVASDLFAVGVMVYEIMAGQHPFEADSIGERILKIMTRRPDFSPLPDEFVPWLEKVLDKDPAERFASAYDAMIAFYEAVGVERPAEDQTIRESFLQASQFVGRDAELTQLAGALETLDTQNAFFLIGGESGVGKSRLLDELRVRALVAGSRVLRGQGVDGGGLPFQLWRNITRHLLLMVEVTDLQASILKDIVPDIDTLLGKEVATAPQLTGKAYQQRIMLTIVDLFRELPRPVVLLLEDLQWAGESLAVLQQMLKVPEQLPNLMVVATYRDDEAPELPEKLASMTHIKLERLTPDAVSELSSAMLGDVGANEDIVQLLHSQSEGNLFFLVETVRALAEASGELERIGQGELPEGVFTGGMQSITRRRLSKVDEQYRDIQTLAAIIGREIDTELLAHAYDDETLQAWLSNASEYGVVSIQDNTWRFAHDKLRETLIADIPDDKQPALHRIAAETIEAVYPDNAGYNEALLSHWQHAGDLDKTYHYMLPVTENMIEIRGAYATAETLLQRLLDQLALDDFRRIALLSRLAKSVTRQGNYDLGKTYATQTQQSATTHDDLHGQATSLNNLGLIAFYQSDYEQAKDLYQQSLAIWQELDDQLGISKSFNNLAIVASSQSNYEQAEELFQQSLTIKKHLGDQFGISNTLGNLGLIAYSQSNYELAWDLNQQSLAMKQKLGDLLGISYTLGNLGAIALDQRDYEQAEDLYQQSLAMRQELGHQIGISLNTSNLGVVAYYRRDYERARKLHQQSLAIDEQLGYRLGVAYNSIGLGRVAFKQEQAEALHWFSQALSTAHSIGATPQMLLAIVGFVGWLTQHGQAERAATLVGLVQQHPAQNIEVRKALDEVMPSLKAALSPDDLAAALERGKSLDLDTVVAELLAEFAPSDEGNTENNA